ncbi:MAG: hypothetical protein RR313_10545, partial [Anaerovoracaceae bacterium]
NKLSLEKTTKINTIKLGDIDIEVLTYLPVEKKMSLIELAIQESLSEGMCDSLCLDAILHLFIVLSYTNITLSPTQKAEMLDTYDLMEKNGLITEIVKAIPEHEYRDLVEAMMIQVEKVEKYSASFIGLFKEAMENIPQVIQGVQEQLSDVNIDGENLQNVLSIAKNNGGL